VSRHLQRDLDRLQQLVLSMAGLVEESIDMALDALQNQNADQARRVFAGDAGIDRLENEVQEECLKLLALHQPVAIDLRRIGMVMLISTDLERMGDLASAIADRAMCITAPPPTTRLTAMTKRVTAMVRGSLNAFVNSDAAAARLVIREDDLVDAEHREIIEILIREMKTAAHLIEPGLSMFSAVRHLEQIADHAVAIAEDVVYLVEGEIVRHKPEKR
jgi:phosphate transport system protein